MRIVYVYIYIKLNKKYSIKKKLLVSELKAIFNFDKTNNLLVSM